MTPLFRTLDDHASRRPGQTAVSDDSCALTYGALPDAIEGVARDLDCACPGNGPIAFQADNSAAWVLIDLALSKRGRIAIPIPPFFVREQRSHALSQAGAAWLITENPAGSLAVASRLFHVQALPPARQALPEGTAKITYTSGTTGWPKGVCLPQAGVERIAQSLVAAIGADYAGVHVAILPLAVLLENVAGLYTTLLAGGHYRVLPQAEIGFGQTFVPDFARLKNALRDNRAKSIILVPELLRGLTKALGDGGDRVPSLELVAVGGARVAPSLLDAAASVGLPVYQGYGLSEAGSVVTLNTPRHNRPGSVGRVLEHVRLSLSSDGALRLSEPGFLGYADGERASEPYDTGDIGWVDADGFVYLTGRRSNVIITSFGRNVSPEWVESELVATPEIAQAFVFGEAAEALGALIVPAGGASDADLDAAIARANANLPEYARVKHWACVLPFLPGNGFLTANGRLRRGAIAESYRDLMRACLEASGKHTTFFDRLVAETASERAYLAASPQIRDGLAGRISLNSYLMYLTEAFHHVRHTVPLLERVRDLLPPSKAWLGEAAEAYIKEETGHEEWILDDIRNAGGDADAARASRPRAATELMVSYAYDFISRINPVGFFGMVFVLEGTSTQLATSGAQSLMRSLGLGPECFSYLTSHGALDLSHIQFLQGLLNRVEDPRDQADIVHMAKRMFVLFAEVFRSIPHDMAVQHAA
jgi:long-subunit acyl-CoA synthetase (AMP-forming)